MIKSPKVYLRDTGLLHTLLGIESVNDLFGHPVYGASWEGFVIENVLGCLKPQVRASFYRTAKGAEADLLLEKGRTRIVIECKASSTPKVSRGFRNVVEDVEAQYAWVIAPIEDAYPIDGNITAASPIAFINDARIEDFFI